MTSTDLKAYLDIIARMRGLLNSAEFEQTFAGLTAGLPKSKQFLIKMELKRLAQPCNYFIDLRGHVDGDVKPFEYGEKTHYLDAVARQLFEDGIKEFGTYTLGIYEDIMNADNNFRVRHRKETEERVKTTLENLRKGQVVAETNLNDKVSDSDDNTAQNRIVQFGYYISRSEERMNFGIEVEVTATGPSFSAMTSDLSVSGCKLKIPAGKSIVVGDIINLAMRGLEKEFTLDLPNGLSYQVLQIDEQEKFSYLRLKRLQPEQEPQFNHFLNNFIHGNKRRYKVNLDNTTDAVLTKGYEQYYLPRINTLPVYLAIADGIVNAPFCLTSDYNRGIWHYFLDERQQSVLNLILSTRRIRSLIHRHAQERACILYTFTHAAKGKLYFYAATDIELQTQSELRNMFFGFGSGKPSWRVFHLNLRETTVEHSTHGSSLAGVESLPVSPLIRSMLVDMHFIIGLTDISANEQRPFYQAYQYDRSALAQLNVFGLSKTLQAHPCEAIPVHYVNLRAESRYLYKTTVFIRLKTEQPALLAFTRDFSTGGLQVETIEPADFVKGDILLLELPDLQKIAPKYPLSNLPYEVIAVSKNKTIMNLKIAKQDGHVGKQFFSQLIHVNRSKLTIVEETPKYPGLSEALRNMYLKATDNIAIFTHRRGLRHDINVIGRGALPNALHSLLQLAQADSPYLDLRLLTKQQVLSHGIAAQLKQMKRQDVPRAIELYITVSEQDGQIAMASHYDFEFKSVDEQKQFLQEAISNTTLFSFKFFISRTGNLDTEYIAKEIGYISVYAIHKARSLEEELWHVEGVADGVEVTSEVILRINRDAVAQQQVARLAILALAAQRSLNTA